MEALLGLAAALAAIAILIRAIGSRRRSRLAPGGSVETAIAVSQFDEIDATVGERRCRCRGRFAVRGEGPVRDAATIRRVSVECRECGREEQLYFDLAGLDHELA